MGRECKKKGMAGYLRVGLMTLCFGNFSCDLRKLRNAVCSDHYLKPAAGSFVCVYYYEVNISVSEHGYGCFISIARVPTENDDDNAHTYKVIFIYT